MSYTRATPPPKLVHFITLASFTLMLEGPPPPKLAHFVTYVGSFSETNHTHLHFTSLFYSSLPTTLIKDRSELK